jgi:putative phosphoesterase
VPIRGWGRRFSVSEAKRVPSPDQFEQFPVPIPIGVVSDNHLTARYLDLPVPLVDGLRDADLILHAGDISTLEALRLFKQFAPVRAAAGNNDEPVLQQLLPRRQYFQFGRFTAGLMHGHDIDRLTARQAAEREFRGVLDLGIFGHSHRPLSEWIDGFLLFNPGSATSKRWEPQFSFGLLHINQGVQAEFRFFPRWR